MKKLLGILVLGFGILLLNSCASSPEQAVTYRSADRIEVSKNYGLLRTLREEADAIARRHCAEHDKNAVYQGFKGLAGVSGNFVYSCVSD
jgi:hypothetical protein